jgi:hypothetical protein
MSEDRKRTTVTMDQFHGNALFERAAFTLGLDDTLQRSILWDACRKALVDPFEMTIDELGAILPEIENRLRLVGLPDQANEAIARLRHFIFDYHE